MTKHLLTLFLALFLSGQSLNSQNLSSSLRGQIIDKYSEFPLVGVTVLIEHADSIMATSSDQDGYYLLENVPVGRHTIQFSFTGYQDISLPNQLLISGKQLELNLAMEEDFELIGEVIIEAEEETLEQINKMNSVSARVLSVGEASKYAGSLLDPARMAQNFAGVSGANDARNDIIIRGNSPTGVLYRLEGLDIPSPNHFSTIGTTGGPISMLNVNNLKNSDFLTSAWSAEYGEALSGVFDLKLRSGNSEKYEHLFQMGFNGFELGSEGPFKKGKRASYLANYRYSTLQVFDLLGIDIGTGQSIPQYQDLTFKLNFPSEKWGRLSLWGLGGKSFVDFAGFDTSENQLFGNENYQSRFDVGTYMGGINHRFFFDQNTFSELALSYSLTQTDGRVDSLSFFSDSLWTDQRFRREQQKWSAQLKLNRKFSQRTDARLGFHYNHFQLDFYDSIRFMSNLVERSNFEGASPLLQGYIQMRHLLNESWTLLGGIHSQHFALSNSTSIEPRLGLTYEKSKNWKLSLGMGMHSKTQPLVTYFNKDISAANSETNKDLDFTRALHTVIGWDWFLSDKTRLKSEIYYQHLYNVPIDSLSSSYSMLNEGADFGFSSKPNLQNKGTGKNMGLELTLEQFLHRGFYYLATLSLFDSKYRGSDDLQRNTAFNSTYVFNGLVGKELNLNDRWSITGDAKITFTGGRPYTEVLIDSSRIVGSEIRDEANAFAQNQDPYFRTDLRLGIRYNGNKVSHYLNLEVDNVTNTQNIFWENYDVKTGRLKQTYQRGIFPIVLYQLYF